MADYRMTDEMIERFTRAFDESLTDLPAGGIVAAMPGNASWSAENSDPLGDIRRFMEKYRAPVPPPPEIRAGAADIARRLLGGHNVPPPTMADQLTYAGIPIRVDPRMPENMMMIGTQLFILMPDETWTIVDLAALGEWSPFPYQSTRSKSMDEPSPVADE